MLPHNTNLVPRATYLLCSIIAIECLSYLYSDVGKLDEGTRRRDAVSSHRLPPDLASFLPAETSKREGTESECPVRYSRQEVNTTVIPFDVITMGLEQQRNLSVVIWLGIRALYKRLN